MYNPQVTVIRIKELSDNNSLTLKQINETCGLNKNTINLSANSKTGLNAKALFDISDCLNCSVDYLLGRTDNPNITAKTYINGDNNGIQANVNTGNLTVSNGEPKLEEMEAQLLKYFRQLEFEQKLNMVGDLIKKAKSNNNRRN